MNLTAVMALPAFGRSKKAVPSVAFTFDDPKVSEQPLYSQFEIADRMLSTLDKAKVKAALCVCGEAGGFTGGKITYSKMGRCRPLDRKSHLFSSQLQSRYNDIRNFFE
jgi:hypothetical protein